MAEVVVVGAGVAGMSVAARLAKLGHGVTVLEAADRPGGQLLPIVSDGHPFDRWPAGTTLPATLRDLFRKSGRQLDRVLDLRALEVGRRHLFEPGAVLDLPMGRRGDQLDAVEAALPGEGERWSTWLDAQTPVWEAWRRGVLERRLGGPRDLDRTTRRALRVRRSLRREVRGALRADELRRVVLDGHRVDGDDPRAVPAWAAVEHLVERSFGRWVVDGGSVALLDALVTRLGERRVEVRTGVRATGLDVVGGRLRGVGTETGQVAAELVVWAAPDPPHRAREVLVPRIPAVRTLVRLRPGAPVLPAEVLAHSDPPVRVWAASSGPAAERCWTIEHRVHGEDVLAVLARTGLDVRDLVEHRRDLSPVDQVRALGASATGWQWAGWRTALGRPGVGEPAAGVFTVGVDAHPGPTTPQILMGTAAVAEVVGRA